MKIGVKKKKHMIRKTGKREEKVKQEKLKKEQIPKNVIWNDHRPTRKHQIVKDKT